HECALGFFYPHGGVEERVEARSAVLNRDLDAKQTEVADLGVDVTRHYSGRIPLRVMRRHLGGQEPFRGLAKCLMVRSVEAGICHGVSFGHVRHNRSTMVALAIPPASQTVWRP